MIRPSLLRTTSAAALLGLLALTGCSSGTDSDETSAAAEEGPLAKIMNAAWGEADQDYYDKQQIETENLVAECMAAEGFEYIPQDFSHTTVFSEEDFADQNTEEWVAANGYGMSMGMEDSGDAGEEPTDDWVDPNADYVSSLSESESTAYYAALYGEPDMGTTEEEMESYEYNWEEAGCQGAAQNEISGDEQAIFTDPRFEAVNEAMTELYESTAKDPRMVELAAEWAGCMADAGFPDFTSPDEAMMSVSDAQSTLYGSDSEEYVEPTSEDIAEFRELELSTALADFRCKEEVEWEKTATTVSYELEEIFVRDYKAELDEYVAAVQDARK